MSLTDTSPAARARLTEIQRNMSGEQRLLTALQMSVFVRDLMKERITREHPDWSEDLVRKELLRPAFLPKPLPAQVR